MNWARRLKRVFGVEIELFWFGDLERPSASAAGDAARGEARAARSTALMHRRCVPKSVVGRIRRRYQAEALTERPLRATAPAEMRCFEIPIHFIEYQRTQTDYKM